MSIFRKKPKTIDDSIREMQYGYKDMKIEFESMKRDYAKLKASIPGIARQQLEDLARTKTIVAMCKYRDEEFLTEVCANRVEELKYKKQVLEDAIDECDKALAGIKRGEK